MPTWFGKVFFHLCFSLLFHHIFRKQAAFPKLLLLLPFSEDGRPSSLLSNRRRLTRAIGPPAAAAAAAECPVTVDLRIVEHPTHALSFGFAFPSLSYLFYLSYAYFIVNHSLLLLHLLRHGRVMLLCSVFSPSLWRKARQDLSPMTISRSISPVSFLPPSSGMGLRIQGSPSFEDTVSQEVISALDTCFLPPSLFYSPVTTTPLFPAPFSSSDSFNSHLLPLSGFCIRTCYCVCLGSRFAAFNVMIQQICYSHSPFRIIRVDC